MTGLAALGAAPAIGWISASTWPPTEPPARGKPSGRSLAVISMAFCEGIAILAVVVGLLAIFSNGPIGTTDEALAAALPLTGAVFGLVLVLGAWTRSDRWVALQAGVFILGLGVLGAVVASLGMIIADVPGPEGNWLYPVLGLVQFGAVLGIAITSGASIRAARGADAEVTRSIAERAILTWAAFELVGIGAFAIAIFLVFTT
jgi:F0F1-type ATP synthase membrane subunit c/vacuolar-type H+-ATPase subunit K